LGTVPAAAGSCRGSTGEVAGSAMKSWVVRTVAEGPFWSAHPASAHSPAVAATNLKSNVGLFILRRAPGAVRGTAGLRVRSARPAHKPHRMVAPDRGAPAPGLQCPAPKGPSMPDPEAPKIIVDSDWKSQAQAEKERLAAAERAKAAQAPA